MKEKLILSFALSSLFLMSGCSDRSQGPVPAEVKNQHIEVANSLPSWVVNPKSDDGITAVGMAGYSRYGLKVMRPQAEMDARARLAGQIQTIVSRSQKQALESVQIANTDDLQSIFSQSTKEVVKAISLSGAVVVNQKMLENGDFYVQMVVKKNDIISEIQNSNDTYKKNLQNANLTRENLDKGMKVLDKMMDDLDKDTK